MIQIHRERTLQRRAPLPPVADPSQRGGNGGASAQHREGAAEHRIDPAHMGIGGKPSFGPVGFGLDPRREKK